MTAAHRGGFIAGTYDGHIYTFIGGSCVNSIKAHDGCTYAIFSCEQGVVSGGKDGNVILYDISLKEKGKWNVPGESIRAVCLGPSGLIVAGTYEGAIYEIDSNTQEPPRVINRGHGGMHMKGNKYSGELWALSMHPGGDLCHCLELGSRVECLRHDVDVSFCPSTGVLYATAGDDAAVRIFSISERK